ncbi:Zn(II)2Cys6 transcription factor domain-containing protein [Aspergillus lucknowensis]|uniref:Zn(2)-C6 fungal-type domain-containing protein n=1 Tax=Aspergillus lucknowensis TaxID=176173 RepID=A0ABR4LUQ1_9EURO
MKALDRSWLAAMPRGSDEVSGVSQRLTSPALESSTKYELNSALCIYNRNALDSTWPTGPTIVLILPPLLTYIWFTLAFHRFPKPALRAMVSDSDVVPSHGETPKLRTACENCRQSKVKCNVSGKDTCIRCLRHGLSCRYRVANRSGKPKGSKNRSTLRKLGQLQESKTAFIPDNRLVKESIETVPSLRPSREGEPSKTLQPEHKLPASLMGEVPDASMFLANCGEYPSMYRDSIVDSACTQGSMSPTFLHKEFITKGLTSFPLSVHIPRVLRPTCNCSESLVLYHDHLRQMLSDPGQVRFDQMLQGVQAALTVCRGLLQCPNGHQDGHKNTHGTSLILCMPTLELSLRILNLWTSYELLLQSGEMMRHETVGYGEYEMGPDETRRVRRFLIRGRLLLCKETFGLFKGASGNGRADGRGGCWLQQNPEGFEARIDTFLQAMSEADCICNLSRA